MASSKIDSIKKLSEVMRNMQSSFMCGICLEIIDKPIRTKCNHSFCHACITPVLKEKKATCPMCKTPISRRSIAEDKDMKVFIQHFKAITEAICMDTKVNVLSLRHKPCNTKESCASADQFSSSISLHSEPEPSPKRLDRLSDNELIKDSCSQTFVRKPSSRTKQPQESTSKYERLLSRDENDSTILAKNTKHTWSRVKQFGQEMRSKTNKLVTLDVSIENTNSIQRSLSIENEKKSDQDSNNSNNIINCNNPIEETSSFILMENGEKIHLTHLNDVQLNNIIGIDSLDKSINFGTRNGKSLADKKPSQTSPRTEMLREKVFEFLTDVSNETTLLGEVKEPEKKCSPKRNKKEPLVRFQKLGRIFKVRKKRVEFFYLGSLSRSSPKKTFEPVVSQKVNDDLPESVNVIIVSSKEQTRSLNSKEESAYVSSSNEEPIKVNKVDRKRKRSNRMIHSSSSSPEPTTNETLQGRLKNNNDEVSLSSDSECERSKRKYKKIRNSAKRTQNLDDSQLEKIANDWCVGREPSPLKESEIDPIDRLKTSVEITDTNTVKTDMFESLNEVFPPQPMVIDEDKILQKVREIENERRNGLLDNYDDIIANVDTQALIVPTKHPAPGKPTIVAVEIIPEESKIVEVEKEEEEEEEKNDEDDASETTVINRDEEDSWVEQKKQLDQIEEDLFGADANKKPKGSARSTCEDDFIENTPNVKEQSPLPTADEDKAKVKSPSPTKSTISSIFTPSSTRLLNPLFHSTPRNEIPPPKKTLSFVCSGLTSFQIERVKELASILNANFSNQFLSSVTHVITKIEEKTKAAGRTLKFLQGVAHKKWIVGYEWVLECLKEEKLVEEGPYEAIDGQSNEPGPKRSRQRQEDLFTQFASFCIGPYDNISLKDFEGLFESNGGTLVKSLEDLSELKDKFRIVFVQADFTDQATVLDWYRKIKAIPIAHDWVMECISRYKLVSFDAFIQELSNEDVLALGYPEQLVEEENMNSSL